MTFANLEHDLRNVQFFLHEKVHLRILIHFASLSLHRLGNKSLFLVGDAVDLHFLGLPPVQYLTYSRQLM